MKCDGLLLLFIYTLWAAYYYIEGHPLVSYDILLVLLIIGEISYIGEKI